MPQNRKFIIDQLNELYRAATQGDKDLVTNPHL